MTIFVMLVSGISLATIYIVNVVDRKIQAAAALRAAAIAQAEKQKREQTIINNMLAELHSLTPDELSLLKYIYHYSCNAVYVPTNNAAGLSLWNRGYLRQTVNRYFPRVHGKAASITTSCYLYEIQPEIKKFLRQFYNSIQWGNSNMEELNKYQ